MKRFTLFHWCALCSLLLLLLAYSNHFNNSFHFDDDHTIVNNAYIREVHNIPQFFKSATTFSSLPPNQTYRPMLTTLYALDYHIGGFNPLYFHIPIFLFYILQGILMYLLIIKLFDLSFPTEYNKYAALFAVTWYMLNPANAEVINYISASSDSISTFWVVAAMVMYIYLPNYRKYMLYLVPVIIGTLFKQSALVFPGLLAVYCFLFESGDGKKTFLKRTGKTLVAILPALVICAVLYKVQAKLTSSTYITGGSPFNYIITQPFVALHYLFTFFLPFGLSADTDWHAFESLTDYRFWIGVLFIVVICYLIFRTYASKKMAPVAFGLSWFLIALLPSALVPLSEVMNDYRAFFPYIGLAIATVWALYIAWEKWQEKIRYLKITTALLILVLVGYAFGTYARNKVWHDDESLWYDVTIKSPDNSRGLMNYGLSQMDKGNYAEAEKYFQKTMDMLPYYPYVYANMAIVKNQLGDATEAENDFKKALAYGPNVPSIYYFYAKFLHGNGRDNEAIELLKQAINLSPADMNSRYMAMQIYQSQENWTALKALAEQTLTLVPGDTETKAFLNSSEGRKGKLETALDNVKANPTANNYINLSLIYFNHKDYQKCIDACNEALKLDPKNAYAFNNMGSAYNALGEWENAQKYFKLALAVSPQFQLAKNNYTYAVSQQHVTDSLLAVIKTKPTADNYINLSLLYYREELFFKVIEACNEVVRIAPTNVVAYNNMCAAYNNMQMWDEAIKAGVKALQLDPNNQLAKNNLAAAKQGKANAGK